MAPEGTSLMPISTFAQEHALICNICASYSNTRAAVVAATDTHIIFVHNEISSCVSLLITTDMNIMFPSEH